MKRQLAQHYNQLSYFEELRAKYGLNVPIEIENSIQEAQKNIDRIEGQLDLIMELLNRPFLEPNTLEDTSYSLIEDKGVDKSSETQQQNLPKVRDLEADNTLPRLTPEQVYVLQRLFQNDYQIHVKLLEGGFNNSGVVRVVRESEQGKRLDNDFNSVKYLPVTDIRREIAVHGQGGILDHYPLPSAAKIMSVWPSIEELRYSSDHGLGAIYYYLGTFQERSQTQSLKWVFRQSPFSEIKACLQILFDEKLSPWYKQKLKEPGKSLGGIDGEYERLYRNQRLIQEGIIELLSESHEQLDSSKDIQLTFLPDYWQQQEYCNPVYWIFNVLKPGQAECFKLNNHYSPIHGDLHTDNILIEQGESINIWLIDFPNAHIGPTVIDFATLEADIKFNLISDIDAALEERLIFEERLLAPLTEFQRFTLTAPWYENWQPENEVLYKAWQFIGFLRHQIIKSHLIFDVREYYLALLNATLPIIYRHHTTTQKQLALTSSAWMCKYLT